MNPQETTPVVPLNKIEGAGALLKSGWSLFTKHWMVLVPIVIVPTIVSDIGVLIGRTGIQGSGIISIICAIAGGVLSVAMSVALVNAVHRLSTDPTAPISLGGQYKIGFSFFWTYVVVCIIATLATIGSTALLLIPGLIVGVYVCMYVYTIVLDGKKGFTAITESYALIYRRWGTVFGNLFAIGLVIGLCGAAFGLISYLIGHSLGLSIVGIGAARSVTPVVQPLSAVIYALVINLIGTAVATPIAVGCVYRMYVSLKATRQADVVTSGFKKWVIAAMVIGVPALIVSFTFFIVVAANQSMRSADGIQRNMPVYRPGMTADDYLREINARGTTTVPQNY